MSKKLPITAKNTKKIKMTKSGALTTSRIPTFNDDFKNAILIVSLLINLAVFVIWLALRVTDAYDEQVLTFFLNR